MFDELEDQYKPAEEKLELRQNHCKVVCPACNAQATSNNLNINDKVGKCEECHSVFSFQKQINGLADQHPEHELLNPEDIDVFQFKNELDITLPQPYNIIEIMIGGFLSIFAFIFLVGFLKDKIPIAPVIISWTVVLYSWISLAFQKKKKIHIGIDKKYLHILRRPKYLSKDQSYDIRDISQLYVKRIAEGSFNLMMVVDGINGLKHVGLIMRLSGLSKAKYLEQEIERYLGIENKVVLEEVNEK